MDHARGNTILESLGRSGRRAFGAAGAAALLAGWAWLTDPPDAGFAGIVFALVSGVFVALLAFRREESSETIPWGQLLWPLLASAAAAGLYWWRVQSFRHYGLEGVPLMFFFALGFWWPGLPVALASRLVERALRPMALGAYSLLVLTSLVGASLGAGIYVLGEKAYYSAFDRVPLEEAAATIPIAVGPGRLEPRVRVEDVDGVLGLEISLAGSEATDYELLSSAYSALAASRSLVTRNDTDTIQVRVTASGATIATLVATEAGHGRPLEELMAIHRSALPGGGRLGAGDLEAMIHRATLAFDLPEGAEEDVPGFQATADGPRLALRFGPEGAPGPADVRLHAAAWAAANHVADATARFYPEIRSLAVEFPGLDTVLSPAEVAADSSRRLQSLLPPGDRIVALELRSLSTPGQTRKEDQQESAPAARRGPGGFTPGEFCPRDPAVGYRIALVRTEGPLTDHLAVDLFEEVPVGAGPIFVTEVAGAGDVTAILGPWEGPLEGPVRVSPGTRDTVAGRELLNLGWFDRSRVSCHGR